MTFADMQRDARFVANGIDSLDAALDKIDQIHEDDLENAFHAYQRLTEQAKVFTDIRYRLGHKIAECIGEERVELLGKTVQRRAHIGRKKWDHDDLLRVVLDSVVANEDGEKIDETPADKLQAVWKMRGYDASLTALRERGIDPDEFCEHRFERWSLDIK